ncbi:up-regulator of cell proliferation-like [Centroberyx gerrardi]
MTFRLKTPRSTSSYMTEKSDGSKDIPLVFKDKQQGEVICDICSRAKAVKTCLTCNISYCDYHVRPHYTASAMQRHILRDVSREVEEKRCHHYHKPLDFFCRTDQMQICNICSEGKHRRHDVILQKTPHAAGQVLVPPPGEITFLSMKPDSVILSWGSPEGLEGPRTFRVKWRSSEKVEDYITIKDLYRIEINNLKLGQKYYFSVATEDNDGNLSVWATASVFTEVPAPRNMTEEHSEATALSLKWTKGDKMEQIPHRFLLTVKSPGEEPLAIHTEDCYKMFSDLKPDTEYIISVSSVLNNQRHSKPVSTTIHTKPCLRKVLSKIGLEDQYENKLTLSTIIEMNQNDISEKKLETMQSLPGAFLKRLMMVNVNARSVKCVSSYVDNFDRDNSNAINPLDLITALFLCSDGLLQQEIVLKMSLCQFAIPLLLPNHETREITMMLWSMREIVRKFRPSNHAFTKLTCEDRIVLSDIPLVSFARLGKSNLSKSQILNKLLSNPQQYHNTFCHRNMECGDVPRRISEGLVEISWYLPCGNRNTDTFTDPVAVANLRGDIRVFDKQFSFLCQTSAAVYIFCDESEADYFKILEGRDGKAKLFLVSSFQGKTFTLKRMTVKPSLKTTNVSQKKRNDTELTKALQESVINMLESRPNKVSVENMASKARCCGILVDEDCEECQSARKNVTKITGDITNATEFKNKQLPSQGHVWKELSWLENESCRLRKAGDQKIDNYSKSLKRKEEECRRKQQRLEMTAAMSGFLHGVVTSEVQRYYFLKWLEIDLDNLSRHQLSSLQDQYKDLCQTSPQEKDRIAKIDKQISDCSLGLEHFFRECGQLYEYTCYLPEYSHQRKIMEHLPALCAQMLLDGFPVELVDGDASNIPMKWITGVLTELHYIMHSNSKIKIITIIGGENTGKSTLLNTMFGVRFAVSRGRGTRGAFMQLININKEARLELGCDCIMIIDTEGLKPHQLAQEDDSHERDKEVASLAVGLSDATIVSISKDNSREMKDILEVVLHAFIRSKDVGKKPLCHFVHTNMSDMPTHERKQRDKQLMEQLNEMIVTDPRMKQKNITRISDVMEYDPDTCSWYIPQLWHGTPPMAPYTVDYSETVHAFKKRLIGDFKRCRERGDLKHLIGSIKSIWKAL